MEIFTFLREYYALDWKENNLLNSLPRFTFCTWVVEGKFSLCLGKKKKFCGSTCNIFSFEADEDKEKTTQDFI